MEKAAIEINTPICQKYFASKNANRDQITLATNPWE